MPARKSSAIARYLLADGADLSSGFAADFSAALDAASRPAAWLLRPCIRDRLASSAPGSLTEPDVAAIRSASAASARARSALSLRSLNDCRLVPEANRPGYSTVASPAI